MAKPREARGWFVYGLGATAAFLMLAFRLWYAVSFATSPYLIVPWVDVPFVIGVLAVALAAIGLHQGLWYSLVKPAGWTLYGSSLLMFVVGTLLLYTLPAHLVAPPPAAAPGPPAIFYLMFTAAIVLYVYTPTLSYGSKPWTGVAAAGAAVLLVASLYGPATGQSPLFTPLVLGTIVAEGLLLLGVLRLLQLTFRKRVGVAA